VGSLSFQHFPYVAGLKGYHSVSGGVPGALWSLLAESSTLGMVIVPVLLKRKVELREVKTLS
jgi:hypothetical protein